VQAHVTRGALRLDVSVSLDGEALVDREFSDLATTWLGSDLYLKLGQAAYGPAAAGALWQDDVVVSRNAVPCGL